MLENRSGSVPHDEGCIKGVVKAVAGPDRIGVGVARGVIKAVGDIAVYC